MPNDIEEQVAVHIREIIHLVLGVKGMTLRKLNELAGQTSKFKLQSITHRHAKVAMVQNYHIEMGQEGESFEPICVQFTPLRRSRRRPENTEYKRMQGPCPGSCRPAKKLKLPDKESVTSIMPTDMFPKLQTANGSKDKTRPGPNDELSIPYPSETPTNASAPNIPAISESPLDGSSDDGPNTAEALESSNIAEMPIFPAHIQIGADEIADDMSATAHHAGYNILEDFFEHHGIDVGLGTVGGEGPDNLLASTAAQGGTDLETTDLSIASAVTSESGSSGSSRPGCDLTGQTSYSHLETGICEGLPSGVQRNAYIKRPVLDDTAPWIEHVLTRLDTDDTGRRPNPVPGVVDMLTKGDFTLCVNVMTSIAENLVRFNRSVAKPTFDAVQDRSREVEGNKVGLHLRRLTAEHMPRLQNQKACRDEFASLNVRELAEIEMKKLLSDPEELACEFREQSDYETAIRHIENGNADIQRNHLRRAWEESYFWCMIQQGARLIGPLPNPSGPRTGISPQEKAAAKKLTLAMRYGQSKENVLKWTAYWKLLSELREQGAESLLLYRTSVFKRYFFQHPKNLEMLLAWNKVYDFPLRQLRARTLAEEGNDFSGRSDIEEKWIFDRLHAPQNLFWGDHLSLWDPDSNEREMFEAECKIQATSRKSNIHILRHGLKGQSDYNKANFVVLVPYEGESGKRTLGTRPSSTELLAVVPIVPILPGDFLGIFAGHLRYTDQKPPRSIPGPVPKLWLDYSTVMGKLGKMGVAKAGEMANVCLAWEGVNESKGGASFCQYLRIMVIATRHIMPLDQLVRPSAV